MVYLITGGQRSGKSRYAQELALELSDNPVYIATARKWDEEFCERIERHIEDRDEQWETFEIEKEIGSLEICDRVVVIDCITLWLTNFFVDLDGNIEKVLEEAKEQFDQIISNTGHYIFVTNEIGMGTHPNTAKGRRFADLQGWMNQYAADRAEEVILMVAGIPVIVKSSLKS